MSITGSQAADDICASDCAGDERYDVAELGFED